MGKTMKTLNMRYLIILIFTILSLSVKAQCVTQTPPLANDSVFVFIAPSRTAIEQCQGQWQNIYDAGVPQYKLYLAYITQTGTDAPSVTVIVNTFGEDATWSYTDVGHYSGTFPTISDQGSPPADNSPITYGYMKPNDSGAGFWIADMTGGTIDLYSYDAPGGTLTDGEFAVATTMVEIRMYNP
jgi:hypothetical protein